MSSHHPQEVLLAQFSLYVHKGGLKPDSFHFICDNRRDENVTVLKMVALPIALAYVVALVRFDNDQTNNVFENLTRRHLKLTITSPIPAIYK